MIISGKLDLTYLYANGFYLSNIDQLSADKALNFIKDESFIEDKEASANIFNPSWDIVSSVEPKDFPYFYREFLNDFLETGFLRPYEEIYGKFTAYNVAINKCPKGYINSWHGHFMDGYHLHLLFHLSSNDRLLSDGGLIEFGLALDSSEYHLDLKAYNQRELKNIFLTGSFLSKHGQFEVLLNSHPMYKHQVTEVLTNSERYTLMLFLGYSDNILVSKKDVDNL